MDDMVVPTTIAATFFVYFRGDEIQGRESRTMMSQQRGASPRIPGDGGNTNTRGGWYWAPHAPETGRNASELRETCICGRLLQPAWVRCLSTSSWIISSGRSLCCSPEWVAQQQQEHMKCLAWQPFLLALVRGGRAGRRTCRSGVYCVIVFYWSDAAIADVIFITIRRLRSIFV